MRVYKVVNKIQGRYYSYGCPAAATLEYVVGKTVARRAGFGYLCLFKTKRAAQMFMHYCDEYQPGSLAVIRCQARKLIRVAEADSNVLWMPSNLGPTALTWLTHKDLCSTLHGYVLSYPNHIAHANTKRDKINLDTSYLISKVCYCDSVLVDGEVRCA